MLLQSALAVLHLQLFWKATYLTLIIFEQWVTEIMVFFAAAEVKNWS